MKEEIKDKDKSISAVDFLTLKIERNRTEVGQEINKGKRAELFKHQDRLVDLLCEESERIRQTKDIDDMEYLMSQLEFLKRDVSVNL